MLEVENLAMSFRGRAGLLGRLLRGAPAPIRAVDGIDFRLGVGETLALVGESGSGKTTTGRLITLQERPSAGRIRFDGRDVTHLAGAARRAYRRAVQMIFQNPYDALDPRIRVGASVAEPLGLFGIGTREERRARAIEALASVDLAPAARFAERYPADLSGGQLQRVAIARALVLSPRLIVADEPVSMLDVSVRAGIMALMLDLQRATGVSYLYITHDLAVARHMAARIAVMYRGAIVEEGPTEAVLAAAGHPYTRLLISAVPEHRPGERRKRARFVADATEEEAGFTGCRYARRCPAAREICRTTTPPSVALAPDHRASCHFADEIRARGLPGAVMEAPGSAHER
jgi:oligopeptide/dipeptide ABC transporter ATP-binding protein